MQFVVINPQRRQIVAVNHPALHDVIAITDLDPSNVDHGMLSRHIGYVVHEFGLFVPAERQFYFRFGNRLIAGTAVLYGVGDRGETIDLRRSTLPPVTFYLGINDVEASIEHGEIVRPSIFVNGKMIWQWPQAAPKERML